MKKIGILTFHRCINYGAYWQVRCLSDFFRRAGHDVQVLDYRSKAYYVREFDHAIRPFRPLVVKRDFPSLMTKTMKFVFAQQRLKRTPLFSLTDPPNFSEFDLIVVGSDEVWNFEHPWLGGVPLFFGERLAPKKLVSYAASFGNYDAGQGLSAEWVARLARFDQISVRDANSMELVDRHLGRTPTMVLDPCLQFNLECRSAPRWRTPTPYLLIYGNKFEPALIEETRQWARARQLRIVSVGYRNDWADVSVLTAGPNDFVRYFQEATAVVTTYFHGCVFSLRFQRPFAAQLSPYRTNKVQGLLGLLNATHRIFDPGIPGRLGEVLSTPIEPDILSTIETHRQTSSAFLDSCLQS